MVDMEFKFYISNGQIIKSYFGSCITIFLVLVTTFILKNKKYGTLN